MKDGGPASEKSLLDWFAGQAMIGYLAGSAGDTGWPEDAKVARWSYEVATAMLAERKKIETGEES